MATSRSWRQHLLGSLQGQLQLATYLAVFVGFTGASGVGLWIGQRNLIQNDERELRRSADSIQMCLVKGEGNPDVVQQELLLHSSMRTSLWLEKADGVLVLPESDHLAISDRAIRSGPQWSSILNGWWDFKSWWTSMDSAISASSYSSSPPAAGCGSTMK